MILPLSVVVWVGLFTALVLSDIYRLDRKKPKASWLTALALPASALANSSRELLILSAAGLFLELLMIRWISSEIIIFAYFKNFVLIACFLGFGLGAYLCRQPMNLLATRSEEHTSELQSQFHLVCRLLLEKKKLHTICPHFSLRVAAMSLALDHSSAFRRLATLKSPASLSLFRHSLPYYISSDDATCNIHA